VQRPAEIIAYMDGSLGFGSAGGRTTALVRFFLGRHQEVGTGKWQYRGSWKDGCPVFFDTDDPAFNPNSLMNVCFLDGHAKVVRRDFHMEKTNAGGVWYWTHMTINR
jgi:prepilin-type processing-associated H-X9-DG protein